MIDKALKNRRKYVEEMVKNGMSVYDCAKMLQISPKSVRQTMRRTDIKDIPASNVGYEMVDAASTLLKDVMKEIPTEKLAEYGVLKEPEFFEYKNIADRWRDLHKEDKILLAVFNGKKPKEVALSQGKTLHNFKKECKKTGYDIEEVYNLGTDLRKKQNYANVWELSRFGFRPSEISEYLNLSQSDVKKARDYAKESGININQNTDRFSKEEIINMILSGANIYDIDEVTGIDERILTKIKHELPHINKEEHPLSYKAEARRQKIWDMYTQDLLTQQEIADRLNLSRTTVVTDLQTYRRDHPEAIDKTYLWRQRNSREPVKAIRINQKDKVLSLYKNGMSLKYISQIVQVNDNKIQRFLDEEGFYKKTDSGKSREQNRHEVWKLSKQGFTTEEIASKLDISKKSVEYHKKMNEKHGNPISRKAEELYLSWNGFSTTEIMEVVGRSRANILRDQHETANFIRNNQDAMSYISEKGGDVIKESEEYIIQ